MIGCNFQPVLITKNSTLQRFADRSSSYTAPLEYFLGCPATVPIQRSSFGLTFARTVSLYDQIFYVTGCSHRSGYGCPNALWGTESCFLSVVLGKEFSVASFTDCNDLRGGCFYLYGSVAPSIFHRAGLATANIFAGRRLWIALWEKWFLAKAAKYCSLINGSAPDTAIEFAITPNCIGTLVICLVAVATVSIWHNKPMICVFMHVASCNYIITVANLQTI